MAFLWGGRGGRSPKLWICGIDPHHHWNDENLGRQQQRGQCWRPGRGWCEERSETPVSLEDTNSITITITITIYKFCHPTAWMRNFSSVCQESRSRDSSLISFSTNDAKVSALLPRLQRPRPKKPPASGPLHDSKWWFCCQQKPEITPSKSSSYEAGWRGARRTNTQTWRLFPQGGI